MTSIKRCEQGLSLQRAARVSGKVNCDVLSDKKQRMTGDESWVNRLIVKGVRSGGKEIVGALRGVRGST